MKKQRNSRGAMDWPTYKDPQGRYFVRYPPEWEVRGEGPDSTAFKDRGSQAALAISYLDEDCAAAQSVLRGRRLNYYLVREFTRSLAGREVTAFEFRDTVSNLREFHVFIPAGRRCCELKWRRSERSGYLELDSLLETMLSTFELVTGKG